jgi:hypothetical protein
LAARYAQRAISLASKAGSMVLAAEPSTNTDAPQITIPGLIRGDGFVSDTSRLKVLAMTATVFPGPCTPRDGQSVRLSIQNLSTVRRGSELVQTIKRDF